MDRSIYRESFVWESIPKYKCPTCEFGHLQFQNDSINYVETATSRKRQNDDDFDPQFMEFSFGITLKCTNKDCNETVFCIGFAKNDEEYVVDEKGNESIVMVENYYPQYFQPPLKMITIPDYTPFAVTEEIYEACKLFYCNPSSSANHLRISIEVLLTENNIKRYILTNNKRIPLSLHKRIELLQSPLDKYKDLLFAIKWLGNHGSHNENICLNDVIDGLSIIELLLEEIYGSKNEIRKLAKIINKKKGPVF